MRWPIAIVIAAVAAAPAGASPGDSPWDGAVFAGPTSPHPTNIAANPAAMLLAPPAKHLYAGGIGTLDQLTIDRTTIDADGSRSDGPNVRESTAGAGGHLGAAWIGPSRMIALLASIPPPDETLAGRDALRYHTRGSRSRAYDVGSFAISQRVISRIWIGVSATYTVRDSVLRFARDTAMEAGRDPARGVTSDCGGAPCGLENPLATELWTVELATDRFTMSNFRASLGVLVLVPWVPGNTIVGLTYQRPWDLGRIARTGTVTVVAAPRDGGAVHTGEVTLFDRLPEVIRFGSRSRLLERLDVVSEVRWRRLSRANVDDLRTFGGDLAAIGVPQIYPRPRGLHDAVAVEVGVEEVDDGEWLRLGARVGYDSGAVADEAISARAPWGHHVTGGVGAQFRLGSRWVLQAAYTAAWQLPITVGDGRYSPIDRLDCVDSGYDYELPACATVRAGYGAPANDGEYRRLSHVGRLSLRLEIP